MILTVSDKSTQRANDIVMSKRAACFVLFILACLWLFTYRTKDFYQYQYIRELLEETQSKLKETRDELDGLVYNLRDRCTNWDPDLPVIYAITPTYARPVQKAELTRLSHTFRLVQNFHWIVIEDAEKPSALVSNLLKFSYLNYTHLVAKTPVSWKRKSKEPNWKKPRGVNQRNAGLNWLRENRNNNSERGVVYFADDDNTYSLNVFSEMRYINKVGVWPVGLVGGLMVEKPLVDQTTGRIAGWNSVWRPERTFPVDMAGFAVNLQYLLAHPEAQFTYDVERGFQESHLLSYLIYSKDELEPKADNCTKVYVWHTRTEEPHLSEEKALLKKGQRSDTMEV